MAQQPIDYTTLAAEFGGKPVTVPPPVAPAGPQTVFKTDTLELTAQPPAVDYGALAAEFGGVPVNGEGEMSEDGRLVFRGESEPMHPLARVGEGVIGGVKSAATHALDLLAMAVPGAIPGMTPSASDILPSLRPSNPDQEMGGTVESVAEYLIPAGGVSRVANAAAGTVRNVSIRAARNRLAERAVRAGVEGAAAGATAMGQGDDPLGAAAAGAAVPAVVAGARGTARAALPRNAITGVEEEAVNFARQRGIPVDAATATGSPYVRKLQKRASDTIGGGGIADDFGRAQQDALAREGSALADAVNPATVTPEQAGSSVRRAVEEEIAGRASKADEAYARLRELEAKATPENVPVTVQGRVAGGGSIPIKGTQSMRLAVDLSSTKTAMRPILDELEFENNAVAFVSGSGKGKALIALRKLMNAPDAAPLSVTDRLLSELKAAARGAEIPALRNVGQGIAATAVKNLEESVQVTARRGGREVMRALAEGRQATRAKFAAADILDELADSSVRTTDRLVASRDSGISLLRDVAKTTPAEVPKIARAVIDEMLDRATAEGGFLKADGLWNTWEKIGPETRRILFPKTEKQLAQFFLFAKKAAENPNKSGTGAQMNVAQITLAVPMNVIARLMYTPAGVAKLMRVMKGTDEIGSLTSFVARGAAGSAAQKDDEE